MDPGNITAVNSALGQTVSTIYSYSLSLVGLCVFIMFLYAGLIYMFPDFLKKRFPMPEPLDVIQDAVVGLILLFSAYVILNSINPDLVGGGTASAPAPSSGFSATPAPTTTFSGGGS